MFKYFLCFTANSKALKQVYEIHFDILYNILIGGYNHICKENDSEMALRFSRFSVNYLCKIPFLKN